MQNVFYLYPDDMLGMQYSTIILVCDAVTCVLPPEYITNVLTRATSVVSCIINTSEAQMKINGRDCYKFLVTNDVDKYIRELDVTRGKSMIVQDEYNPVVDPASIANDNVEVVGLNSANHDERDQAQYGVVVHITRGGDNDIFISDRSFIPHVDLLVVTGTDEYVQQREYKALEYYYQQSVDICKFFKQYSSMAL